MPEATVVAPTLQSIPVDKIRPAAHQARKTFDEESIKALAESIKQEGLLQPILVRPIAEGYELVSGERRLRAAKLLAQPTIEAKVIQPVSEAETVAKGLVENLQREDLNPIEEAEGIQALLNLQDSHWTQEQIAKVLGKKQSHLSESLRFMKLSDQIKDNIRRRIITEGHAVELLRLPSPELQEQVAKKIEGGYSVMETRKWVNKLMKVTKPKKVGRPRLDPMAKLWPALMADPAISACNYWTVEFKKDEWNFKASATKFGASADFATWFRQMADHLEKAASGPFIF